MVEIKRSELSYNEFINNLINIRSANDVKYYTKLYKYATNFLLYYNTKIIGICSGYMNDIDNKIAFISYIGILEEYQHNGYGQLLIDAFIEESLNNNMQNVRLEVNKNNIKAQNFYKKNGFNIEIEKETSLILLKSIR